MTTATKPYRYQLPKKAVKGDCPECGHRRTLSRYIDTQTGDPLPEPYGRCDRESNCNYHLGPYHKGPSGMSYADEQKQPPLPKAWFRMAGRQKRNGLHKLGFIQTLTTMEGATLEQAERVAAFVFDKPDIVPRAPKVEQLIYCIPNEVFQQSLGYYDRNQLAILLRYHLGDEAANALLKQFHIGTSSRWPGGCVFWYIDQQNRIRSGQIKLFDETFHTVKYIDSQGEKRSKTSWVHSAYARRCDEQKQPYPDWLVAYLDEKNAVDKSPCLFGLPQLKDASADTPVAIVESPKTAIICTHYFPEFVWLAVGGKSYLNAERLSTLKGRKICLFPDLNAYYDLVNEKGQVNKGWLTKSKELQAVGFDITVSDYLESQATDEQRAKGLDLADFLLESHPQTEDLETQADELVTPERIQESVTTDQEPNTYPQSTLRPYKIPRLIQHYWTMFNQPPLPWNRWETLRYIREWVESIPETEPIVVTSIAEQLATPGSAILRPNESQIERLEVDPSDAYPDDWDTPNSPDAVPTIKPLNFFEWQCQHPDFAKLGIASIETNKQP